MTLEEAVSVLAVVLVYLLVASTEEGARELERRERSNPVPVELRQ